MVATKAFLETGSIAGAIAATISLPDEYEPMRISSNYRTTPCALAKPTEEEKYTWAGAQPNGYLPTTDALIFLFRNAALHWLKYVGSAPAAFTYEWQWNKSATNPELFPITGPLGHFELEPQYATAVAAFPYQPHGPIMAVGIDAGHNYVWVDSCPAAQTTINVLLANVPVLGDEGSVKLWFWLDGRRNLGAAQPIVLGQQLYPFITSGSLYTAITIDHTAGPTDFQFVTIRHLGLATCPVMEHHMLAGFADNAVRVQRYAITASSLLWRNTASFENAQGDMGAVQIGSGLSWTDAAQFSSYSEIAAAFPNGFESRFGAKGQYGYLKPEDEEDIEYKTSTDVSNDQVNSFYFPLVADAPFLVFIASVAPEEGRETTLRIASHVQYQTNDSWADVQPSDNLVDAWNEASKILNYLPQFYDNPQHKVSLLSRIANAGKSALDFAEKALSNPAANKIPVVSAGLGLIKNLTIPILKRGFQLVGDYDAGNFKGASYDDTKAAIQRLDPRQGFNAYKM